MSTPPPPTYTPSQLQAFYEHVNLPKPWRYTSLASLPQRRPGAQLELLTMILRYALVTIPFENLTLHYSTHKTVVLDHDVLFDKVVGGGSLGEGERMRMRNCRGGYCMENNLLLATVLRTVGFRVRSVGGRVFDPPAGWTGWGHMVNLVIIGDTKYLIDIGFGSTGPIRPIPLPPKQSSEWPAQPNTLPAYARLVWRNPARQTAQGTQLPPSSLSSSAGAAEADDDNDEGLKLWIYETRLAQDKPWKATYCFTETAYHPRDFAAMSFATSKSLTSWFTQRVVATRMVLRSEVRGLCRLAAEECQQGDEAGVLPYQDDEGGAGTDEDDIVGQMILERDVKLRVQGKTRVVQQEFESESERVEAFRRWYTLRLTPTERRAIKGMSSEVKDKN